MKKSILTSLFLLIITLSYAQNFGAVLTPQQAKTQLKGTAKELFMECVKMSGYPLDSMKVIEPENEPGRAKQTCTIKTFVCADTLFRDDRYDEVTMVKTVTEEHPGPYKLKEPRFMVFVLSIEGGTKVTLQMYY